MINDAQINMFSIYSNPMQGEVYVDFGNNISTASYRVFDNQGQIVKENNNLINRNTISLKALPAGMYTVKIKSGNKVIIKKFLKL